MAPVAQVLLHAQLKQSVQLRKSEVPPPQSAAHPPRHRTLVQLAAPAKPRHVTRQLHAESFMQVSYSLPQMLGSLSAQLVQLSQSLVSQLLPMEVEPELDELELEDDVVVVVKPLLLDELVVVVVKVPLLELLELVDVAVGELVLVLPPKLLPVLVVAPPRPDVLLTAVEPPLAEPPRPEEPVELGELSDVAPELTAPAARLLSPTNP